jgi:predicted chitinase
MGKLLKIDLVDNPDLAARPDYAAQIAVSYWNTRVANKTNTNNIAGVTKKISGSSKQGIKSRTEKLKKYTRELGDRVLPKKKSKSHHESKTIYQRNRTNRTNRTR